MTVSGPPDDYTTQLKGAMFEHLSERTGVGAQSEQIVDAIIADLQNRKGLRQEWDEIDDGVQAEIRDAWMLLARRVIERG